MTKPSLLGTRLAFSRSGRHLLVAEPDGVSIVDRSAGRTVRVAVTEPRAVAGFDDQVWIATKDDHLLRVELTGREIGERARLPFASQPVLVPAPCGPPAAVWPSQPALAVVDDLGQLAWTTQPDVDAIVPLTGRRFVVARGARLALPSGLVAELSPGSVVLSGAVLADGKSAVLHVTRAGQRSLAVLSFGTGQVVQRVVSPGPDVRAAIRRGIVVALTSARTVWAADLRAGAELGTIELDDDVNDLAIDPDGQRLAIRRVRGAVELLDLVELLQRPVVAPGPRAGDRDAASRGDHAAGALAGGTAFVARSPRTIPEASVPGTRGSSDQPWLVPGTRLSPDDGSPTLLVRASADEPPSVSPEVFVVPPLTALLPRHRPPGIDRAEARAQLERELRGVALWTLAAIAGAWDSRRLGYGNEGRHPYELEVGALLGVNSGHATDHVAAARERLAAHDAEVAGDPRSRAANTPLGALGAELGLDGRALDILMVIAAASLRGEIARLYGILGNDPARATVDELLVHHVLDGRHDRDDLAAELDARAPLVRLGVVQIGARRARPFAELTVEPVILDRLRAVAPELGAATVIRPARCVPGALDLAEGTLAAACASLARPTAGPARIVLRGRIGSGRRTLLAALAASAERDIAVIDALALPRGAEAFVAELTRSLRRAQLAGFVPCVVQLSAVTFDEHAGRDIAAEALRLHPGPIALVESTEASVAFPAGHIAIELPVLSETERRAVWRRVLGDAGLRVADVELLAARYKIGPGVIRQAVAAAGIAPDAPSDDVTPRIEHFIRQTRDARIGAYARRVERLASWSSVVLPPDILDSLRELIARVRHGKQVFETWGMGRLMSTSRGLTALFQGQPGTGKTLVAGVIARELGLDLYQVDLSKVMSKWIGETERNLSAIFDAAEDGQVVLLFDEADSLFAKRTEVRSSNDRYANLEVNYLLQRLDAFQGIAILTTNIGTSIDQAFKRRLSFRLSFPFPDEETREQLWRAHLPPELPVHGALALDTLSHKYQLSGGYIRNACLRAAFLAAQEETALQQDHLERAVALEFAELGKLSSSGAID